MTARYCWPVSAGLSCCTRAGENRRRSHNAATKAVVPARATLEPSKFSIGRRGWVRAGCRARFGLHRTLDDAEVVPPIKPKAVLEHRAPKRSASALAHSRNSISHRKRHKVDLNCLKSNLLPASCRQLKLVSGRLGEASAPFSVADKFIQRGWNVPTNGYDRDALPHASVLLPFAKLAGAQPYRCQKTCGQDGRGPICPGARPSRSQEPLRPSWPHATNLSEGARASTPAETTTALNTATSPFPLVCHFHTPKRPQTNHSHPQSLRPGWPRSNLPRRATVPVAEDLQPRWARATAQ